MAAVLALSLGLLGAALPVLGHANEGGAPGGGSYLSGGGEIIVSLPKNMQLPPQGHPLALLPSFEMEGPPSDIDAMIEHVEGSGFWDIEEMMSGSVTVRFYGRVCVKLHRQKLESDTVQTSLGVGPVFVGGVTVVWLHGNAIDRLPMPAGSIPLNLGKISASGTLEGGDLVFKSFDPTRTKLHVLAVESSAKRITVETRD